MGFVDRKPEYDNDMYWGQAARPPQYILIDIAYSVHHLTKPQELKLEMLYIYCIHEESGVLIFSLWSGMALMLDALKRLNYKLFFFPLSLSPLTRFLF